MLDDYKKYYIGLNGMYHCYKIDDIEIEIRHLIDGILVYIMDDDEAKVFRVPDRAALNLDIGHMINWFKGLQRPTS